MKPERSTSNMVGFYLKLVLTLRPQSEPFLGVAALDVDIPQMKEIMTGMFSGVMYAFMINNNGNYCA